MFYEADPVPSESPSCSTPLSVSISVQMQSSPIYLVRQISSFVQDCKAASCLPPFPHIASRTTLFSTYLLQAAVALSSTTETCSRSSIFDCKCSTQSCIVSHRTSGEIKSPTTRNRTSVICVKCCGYRREGSPQSQLFQFRL